MGSHGELVVQEPGTRSAGNAADSPGEGRGPRQDIHQVQAPRDWVTKATKQRGKFRVKALEKIIKKKKGTGSMSVLEAEALQKS